MSTLRFILLATILMGCKDKPKPPAAGPADPTPTPTPAAKVEAPKSPTLPARPTLPGASGKPTAETRFAAETRDDDWAPTAETQIRRRFTNIRGAKLEDTECRQSQCRLVIAGSEGEVGRTIADLESNRGLHGYAKNILLTAPEKKTDGSLVLHAFALFDR